MNAVDLFATRLPPAALRRIAALRVGRFAGGAPYGGATGLIGSYDAAAASATSRGPLHGAAMRPRAILDIGASERRVRARWGADLCGLLNALTRAELADLARATDDLALEPADAAPDGAATAPALRERLWERGAAIERNGAEIPTTIQPRPVLLGGHLVIQAAPRGAYPPARAFPREIPEPAVAAPPDEEPETLDDLLAAADRAIGVRLGKRGADKGAWGVRAAGLLGVSERGDAEPDWRGDVELKTVPVAQDPSGRWRVVEDPAIAMAGEPVLAKLARTLWLARANLAGGDAAIVSWYLLDWDPEIARLARRYLHERPKGPAGTDQRGIYLHKRFFADAGLLATLNGWAA